jgi:hypothetical protein
MKLLSYACLILISFLTVCKKNTFDPGAARLQQAIHSYNNNQSSQAISYDASGRITKVALKLPNGTERLVANISYAANEILINTSTEPAIQEQHEIRYQLNSLNQPILRKEIWSYHFNHPDGHKQDDYYNYETIYQYDANGLLLKSNASKYDSVWSYSPSQNWFYGISNKSEVTDFLYADNNLVKIKTTTHVAAESWNILGNVNNWTRTEEQVWDFEYDKKFPNKTDFSNSIVLRELKIFETEWYPFNPQLSYFPNKITFSESVNNTRTTSEYNVSYDKHGFLSSLAPLNNPGFVYYFVYNN